MVKLVVMRWVHTNHVYVAQQVSRFIVVGMGATHNEFASKKLRSITEI